MTIGIKVLLLNLTITIIVVIGVLLVIRPTIKECIRIMVFYLLFMIICWALMISLFIPIIDAIDNL